MSEKVLFSIKGLHSIVGDPDGKPDEIEVINVADYYIKEGTRYIMYEEIMEGTEQPTKNIVKIKNDQVEITKKGAVNVRMYFEKGKSDDTSYLTPEGQISMSMDTKDVSVQEKENTLLVEIEYAMKINYVHVADCKIEMKIQFNTN